MDPAARSRIVRSLLFVPADRPDRFEKALRSGADAVVFDLEDAVGPSKKDEARTSVLELLRHPPSIPTRKIVRINPPGTPEGARDLEEIRSVPLEGVMVPKVETPHTLLSVASFLHPSTPLLPIVETALGVLHAEEIAGAARVEAIVFGAEDLARDSHLVRSKTNVEVLVPRCLVALSAHARRVQAIDQAFLDIEDTVGLEEEARQARSLGYTGKLAIHPLQIPPIHRAFAPTPEEVEEARALLEEAEKHKFGVFRFRGKMVDRPVVEQARRTLELSKLPL